MKKFVALLALIIVLLASYVGSGANRPVPFALDCQTSLGHCTFVLSH